jgi:hypothetical protein
VQVILLPVDVGVLYEIEYSSMNLSQSSFVPHSRKQNVIFLAGVDAIAVVYQQ